MRRTCVAAAAVVVSALAGAAHANIGDVYIYDVRGTAEFFRISLSDPTNRTFINSAGTFVSFGMDFDPTASTLYIHNNLTGELGTMSLTTGAFTGIGVISGLNTGEALTGITIAPNGTAYVSTAVSLYTMNLATGAATLVAPFTGAGTLMIDIAADRNGLLYGHDIGTDSLYLIDATTGVSTLIGAHGLAANFAQGMDFDWSTNTLYATIYTGAGTGRFVSWDTSTGAVTTIVDTGAAGWNMEMEMAVRSPIPAPGAVGLLGTLGLLGLRRRR